jgi:hypothetical protein
MLVKILLILNFIATSAVLMVILLDSIATIKLFFQRKRLLIELNRYNGPHPISVIKKIKGKVILVDSTNVLPFKKA